MTELSSDFELLQAWGDGDVSAGRLLYERYLATLARFVRTKVQEGRDDLLQNVWLACVEGRHRIRNCDSFRAYLLQTARFQLYAYYRKRKSGPLLDVDVSSVSDLGSSPSNVVAQREQHRLLLEALRQMPLDYQIVVKLRFWEGLSGPEIAARLCIPEATVRSRLRRSNEQLRMHMAAARIDVSPEA